MFDILKELLLSPFGSFASIFSLFALAFWLVYVVTKKITEIKTSQDKIESSVDNVYKRIDTRVDKIEGHIDDIRKDISFLKAMVEIVQSDSKHAVAQRKSPISLTDLGNTISKKINAEEMVSKNWDKIYEDLEKNVGNKNAYDIQQYCMDTSIIELSKFINESDLDKVKMFAFKEGKPLAFYAPIFAILIRDKYFRMKNIDVLEVDSYHPV